MDWTRLQKNNGYFTKFQEYGTRLGTGDFLRYQEDGIETTARIRATKKDEYKNFSGYVINYTETQNGNTFDYNIPITQNLEYSKVNIEMCGGAYKRHTSTCTAEKQLVEKSIEIYLLSRSGRGLGSTLDFYKAGIFPGSGGTFTNDGYKYINVFSKTSLGCDLVDGYREFEKELYKKHISCYTRTGNLCNN